PALSENSVTCPAVVTLAIWPAPNSVTHTLPSGPVTRFAGLLEGVGRGGNSVIAPVEGVIFAMRFPLYSVNQRLPSGPRAIPVGPLLALRPDENSVMTPVGV